MYSSEDRKKIYESLYPKKKKKLRAKDIFETEKKEKKTKKKIKNKKNKKKKNK